MRNRLSCGAEILNRLPLGKEKSNRCKISIMRVRFGSNRGNEVFDNARIRRLEIATLAAISGVEYELEGLGKRIDDLTCSLALTLGDEEGIFFDREPSVEKELVGLERHLIEAEQRSLTLKRYLAVFNKIEKLLSETLR